MAKNLLPDHKPQSKPSHEQIANRAYQIFEENGRTPGRDVENWLAAETQLAKELVKTYKAQNQPATGTKLLARPVNREPVQARA
jgi:hypothetical protein